jgi:hypothetical protein
MLQPSSCLTLLTLDAALFRLNVACLLCFSYGIDEICCGIADGIAPAGFGMAPVDCGIVPIDCGIVQHGLELL